MAAPDYQILRKSVQTLLVGHTQAGDLISTLSFFESRLKRRGYRNADVYCVRRTTGRSRNCNEEESVQTNGDTQKGNGIN
jgi:hypothetical protein